MVKRLREFLDSHSVGYEVIPHREEYTSQEIAAAGHISSKAMAKVVMIRRGAGFVMAVLPAACKVSTDRLEKIFDEPGIAIAREHEFAELFPDCETGAMPPFGNLYGLEVYVDEEITKYPRIVFQAGNHYELASLSYAAFSRLVQPKVGEFCSHV
ncbi:MAG: YbaK/EbsC family protein [Candidatus Tectomicrobia bacterium]|uniref:YbaK/EbsC family protein n=1 Tax=Tectimicrobiota bacterium TaxID=2528274 RepID=A0A932GPA6_UNCTE|nr:YbaK/EbsC family protein [Candidatus Tectomicrobia bacterium]